MAKNILILTTVLALFILPSCRKTHIDLAKTDYIVFGYFYGECEGPDCINFFRLEKDKLYKDLKSQYPDFDRYYSGTYIQLSKDRYNKAKNLMDYFPEVLLDEGSGVIGQPDAGDWGGIYVEYNFDHIRRYWVIDQKKSNVPEEYHEFIDQILEISHKITE